MGKSDNDRFIGKNILQSENVYKHGGIWCSLFLATIIRNCLTINKFGIIDKHKTFKGFRNATDNLDTKNILIWQMEVN